MSMTTTAMAGHTPLPVPLVREGADARRVLATWYAEQLACRDAEIARLRARIAELEARHRWDEFALPPPPGSRTVAALIEALLPPGRPVHRDLIARRVWPERVAAGIDCAHLVRVNLSRARAAFQPHGWTLPGASTRNEYVLLPPAAPLPAGYAVTRKAATLPYLPAGARRRVTLPCPECDGQMDRESPRCIRCTRRRRATGRTGALLVCPTCAGPKSWNAVQCQACDLARRMKRDGVAP
jgi:hypothetical protein